MPSPIYKHRHVERVGKEYDGPLIQGLLHQLFEDVKGLTSTVTTIVSSGGGSGSSANVEVFEWIANGPYTVDTEVDGARVATGTGTIMAVWLTRTTPGTSGSTTLDISKNGVTIYTTQANRPSIAFNDADEKVLCALPDLMNVAMGDVFTVDTDAIEGGVPENWRLVVQAG